MNAKRMEWAASFILFIVGGIFLLLSLFMIAFDMQFKSQAIEHTATITHIERSRDSDGDTRHTVYVRYSVNGQEYNRPLGYYSYNMSVGDPVQIYYHSENPNRITSKGAVILPLIFLAVGLIVLSIGIILSVSKLKKKKLRRLLLEDGRKIYAEITEITRNTFYRVNGRSPFMITCKWTDPQTGLFYFYRSENIWFNPEPIIHEKALTSLPVYINRENPKKYVVVLDEIEKCIALA